MSRLDPISGLPTGFVGLWAGGPVDSPGWLICDGRAVSRTTFAKLFSVMGTVFGVGDGSTTFNVPDFRGRSPVGTNDAGLPGGASGSFSTRNEGAAGGQQSHALTTAEIAAHSHVEQGQDPTGGAANRIQLTDLGASAQNSGNSTATTGSGAAHNTMHPFLVCNFIIKT